MKKTLFIYKMLSSLVAIVCFTCSGNTALGGTIVNFPGEGVGLDKNGNLIATGSNSANTINMSGGVVTKKVFGANATSGNADNNTVNISGGTVMESVNGAYASSGSCSGNTVNISGGVIRDDVYGASTYKIGGFSNGNTINIYGGSVMGDVVGGSSYINGSTINNTIRLGAGARLSATSQIYGGFGLGTTGNHVSGNRLILDGFHGTVNLITNFEFIDITSSGKEEDMIIIGGGTATNLNNVKVSIAFTGMDRRVDVGETIYLIRNDAGISTTGMTLNKNEQQEVEGVGYVYDLEFKVDGTSINALVTGKTFNDRSKALAEGRVATMAHLNMGADLVADQGVEQAVRTGKAMAQAGKQINLFAAMSATTSRYDTGSHIDLYGYSSLVGAAVTPSNLTSLTCGLFAESGWGHYGAMNQFEDQIVRGSGRSKYYGGGLMTQYDFTQMGVKGLTVDASFRAGKAETSYSSGDIPNSHYDLNAPYYGIHTGINYTRQLTDKLGMVSYARFLWTHMDGDSTPIDGSDFRFRTMDSQRIKTGARFFYQALSCLTPYAGASYEWECSGTARAVVDGENGMSAPSLRGGTGTGELGAVYQPAAELPLWIDLSVQGHVGERQGITGGIRVRAEF